MWKSKHPLYDTWRAMKKRCYQPSHDAYKNYGARGITVCERWRNSFDAFVADMGPKPSPKHSIDRIDNDGHYEPGNCRWATSKQQCNNYRDNHRLTAGGRTQTLKQWSEETRLPESTILNRLYRGHSEAQAVGAEPLPRRKLADLLPEGWTAMAKRAGLKHQTVLRRVQIHGWTFERAISTPLQSKPFERAG